MLLDSSPPTVLETISSCTPSQVQWYEIYSAKLEFRLGNVPKSYSLEMLPGSQVVLESKSSCTGSVVRDIFSCTIYRI